MDNISLMLLQLIVGGIDKHILCNLTGRGLWKPCALFSQDLPYVPFVLADFALYSFSVLNNNMTRTINLAF